MGDKEKGEHQGSHLFRLPEGFPAVPQLKEKTREAISSAWLVMAFVPLLNWTAFFWIGARAKQRKWTLVGCLYFLFSVPLFTCVVVLLVKKIWWVALALYLLHLLAWAASIVHALRSRKEYLVRCEALAGEREDANRAYREKILQENLPAPPAATAQDIYGSQGLNPDGIRKYLEQLGARHPGAAELLSSCAQQVGSVQARRASLDALIGLHSASYLTDATGALREAEQLILQNLMWVVNRGIVSQPGDGGDQEFAALIRQVLAANDEVLEKCRTLVAGACDLVSGKGGTGSTAMVEAWIVAIRQQVRSSTLNTKEEEP